MARLISRLERAIEVPTTSTHVYFICAESKREGDQPKSDHAIDDRSYDSMSDS